MGYTPSTEEMDEAEERYDAFLLETHPERAPGNVAGMCRRPEHIERWDCNDIWNKLERGDRDGIFAGWFTDGGYGSMMYQRELAISTMSNLVTRPIVLTSRTIIEVNVGELGLMHYWFEVFDGTESLRWIRYERPGSEETARLHVRIIGDWA